MITELRHLDFNGTRLAYRVREGRSPTLMFLPGYASNMDGTKAVALDAFAQVEGLAMLRFDYSGTGSSEGSFADRTLGIWLDEALHMLDHLVDGPALVLGSSMGGWLALLLAKLRPERVAAVIGIAAAPDFTEWGYSDADKQELRHSERVEQPNPYGGEPQLTTFAFWDSGQSLRVLDGAPVVDCPVRLIHGECDRDVPVEIALRTLQRLRSADIQLTIIKGGGHRLSERHEIETILRSVASLVGDHR
jgi:pimeloyl-ACP methyl ester carboxylesterase